MDGPAFYAWLRAEWPDQARRVAFVTRDALEATAPRFLEHVRRPMLEKPFARAGLMALVAEMRGDEGSGS